ncbi:hypothetical protein HTZ77_19770 [Nonomuraea sp. SMC257]|uniref:Uncharacterized protein n=1 Tax=Nonomuraea montanisoli TaxID=2741721 RepID=A0A7Y6IA18_9ACTN|nr:hypothetical protein [Nonomuraea montanisoli]NUW33655.1 hypothetical protein [Nonomuraea montanisoli]
MAFRDKSNLHGWPDGRPARSTLPVAESATQLQRALDDHQIGSDVHQGYGLALVSVWVGLVVWCDGERYWWRTGWDALRKRVVYAWHPALEPVRAARRVALRYTYLRDNHPHSELITGLVSATRSGDEDVR